jgi:hypothetical protein
MSMDFTIYPGGRDLRACTIEKAPELLHEDGQGPQLAGVDEVEEAPELPKIVLQRRPRQDEPVRRVQLLHGSRHLGYSSFIRF